MKFLKIPIVLFLLFAGFGVNAQSVKGFSSSVKEFKVAEGWANNSVNAVIFRKNSIVTHEDTQYIAFYNPEKYMVLAKRKLGTDDWSIEPTPYQGKTTDAHNSISIMVDGDGYLHVSWDHHNNPLRYAKSTHPGSLQLSEKLSMTGLKEDLITYPEFHKMPNGDLLFFYRYGESGSGNLIINRYNVEQKEWGQLQNNLIDGEGERNAYWQACVDRKGTIHVSWVWRETWDVASNHDLCYARSKDGGKTWTNSRGEKYKLPIRQETAEIAFKIPQNSELINQTSMTTDSNGNPVIATYFKEEQSSAPQYHVVYLNGSEWESDIVFTRATSFSLSGAGTKRIPISRPQILIGGSGEQEYGIMVFRDLERGNKPSVAFNENFPSGEWEVFDLAEDNLGSWEPTYDTELWKNEGTLGLFTQKVEQVDAEGLANVKPQMVKVLEWHPKFDEK